MKQTAGFGTWASPISAQSVASAGVSFSEPQLHDDSLFWREQRPEEGGRQTIMQQCSSGKIVELLPAKYSASTKVHEYGGGCYTLLNHAVYFVNDSDQQIYRLKDHQVTAVTQADQLRFADFSPDPIRNRLYAVAEDHSPPGEPKNSIVAIDLADHQQPTARIIPLLTGQDFYASPRITQDGTQLAWLSWNHPNMPWHKSDLWQAQLSDEGSLSSLELVSGQNQVSLFQPHWSSLNQLHIVSDQSGWWNLYQYQNQALVPLAPMAADFALPLWQLNMRTYSVLDNGDILATAHQDQGMQLLSINNKNITRITHPFSNISQLWGGVREAAFVGYYPDRPEAVIRMDYETHTFNVVAGGETKKKPDSKYLSYAQNIKFKSPEGGEVYSYFYPPTNPDFAAPEGEKPPLIVSAHGGPTAASDPSFNPKIQFWTSRGFAFVEVNYRGSSTYGRAYREAIKGRWGIVDVEDCMGAANYLVEQGAADPDRLCIRGGSSGGYTALAALTFHDLFKVGASYYGIGDLVALTQDTHKFESRYLDYLIGSWPECSALYTERSPIHHTDKLSAPVIFLQGGLDKVVPKNQTEAMVKALTQKNIPVSYVAFPDEGHGFVRGENISKAIESELAFYGDVLKFTPTGISNEESRSEA